MPYHDYQPQSSIVSPLASCAHLDSNACQEVLELCFAQKNGLFKTFFGRVSGILFSVLFCMVASVDYTSSKYGISFAKEYRNKDKGLLQMDKESNQKIA